MASSLSKKKNYSQMIKRYAIEPGAVADPRRLRYVLEKMGLDEGRVILEFPKRKKWIKQLYDGTEDQGCRKKITEVLKNRKSTAFVGIHDAVIGYEDADWASNARRYLNSQLADGVVFLDDQTQGVVGVKCIGIDSADDSFFSKCRSLRIECSATEIANVAKTVIYESKHVTLVDPYFDIGKISDRLVVLEALMNVVRGAKNVVSLTIVCESDNVKRRANFEESLKRTVEARLFNGLEREFFFEYRLVDSQKSTNLNHERLLLTEKAGIRYDRGFLVRELAERKGEIVMQSVSMEDEEARTRNLDLYVNGSDPSIEIEFCVKYEWLKNSDGRFGICTSSN